ncbi:MAG: XdhC family protein, partial [Bacteroidetes bacterium]|nr:XdhC family protein [Bacteroidota bacterium]
MKEIEAIVKMYDKIDFQQSQAALATVVGVEGSSYRRTGARMLIQDHGSWTGGISGGCLEGDARRRAKNAIVQDKASIVTYDTTEDDAHQIGVGLGCNGIIDVLITPLKQADKNNPVELLRACTNARKTNVLITITKINSSDSALQAGQMFLFESEEKWRNTFLAGTILNDQILKDINIALNQKKSAIRQYVDPEVKEIQLFIEVLPPAVHLVLYGSNYDIYPMVNIGKELGWKVSVVANIRQINKSLYQQADQVIAQKTA